MSKKVLGIVLVCVGAIAMVALFRYLVLEKIDSEPSVINDGDRMIQVYQSQPCELNAVISGDTITCKDGIKVKLCGVTAPVNNTQAIAKLKELLQGKEITLSPMMKSSDRIVAEVFIKISQDEEKFINSEMIRSGLAKPDPREVNICLGRDQILEAGKK